MSELIPKVTRCRRRGLCRASGIKHFAPPLANAFSSPRGQSPKRAGLPTLRFSFIAPRSAPPHLPSSRLPHIVRNVLVVAVSFGLAAAAGLVRNMVIAAEFGIGADLDTYYAAFKLPDLLFTIVAGGALATAFIPVFADFLAQDDRADAWRLASAITNHRVHSSDGNSHSWSASLPRGWCAR